jgi:hypothetical protein
MDAYQEGKGTKEAQIQVKNLAATNSPHIIKYESVAQIFD